MTRKKKVEEFATLELNLDKFTREHWCIFFKDIISKKFSPASASLMKEATGENFEVKAIEAIRNEVLVEVIKYIAETEGKIPNAPKS